MVDATTSSTVPLPVRDACPFSVIHGAELAMFQGQPCPVATLTDTEPPAAATECVSGLTSKVQPWPWVTVNVCPAIDTVPLRAPALVDATTSSTVPLPVRDACPFSVIHGAELAMFQGQPCPVATLTDTEPPAAATECVSGLTSKVQPWPWVTVNVCPAISAVPDRSVPPLGATVNATAAGPSPAAGDTVNQLTLLAAVQAQPAPVAIATDPDPPAGAAANDDGVIA